MLLNISELLSVKDEVRTFKVSYEENLFKSEAGEFKITDSPEFDLKITNIGPRKITIEGEGSITLDIPCGRCLEDVATVVDFTIDRAVDLNDKDEESVPDEDLEETNYIDGYHLDVDKLVYTEILINLPLKVLCSSNCKGLCFSCGANLNKGECGCNREQLDPRMSVIQDIFKNFKEV